MSENYFMGLDGFVWFTGVVEDRNDPDKLGRVRVRCLGFHTENLNDIPTADLPWATVMHPVTNPSMQGLGQTPSFLVEGTWVVGFFTDAKEKQQPIIMGTLPANQVQLQTIQKVSLILINFIPLQHLLLLVMEQIKMKIITVRKQSFLSLIQIDLHEMMLMQKT